MYNMLRENCENQLTVEIAERKDVGISKSSLLIAVLKESLEINFILLKI